MEENNKMIAEFMGYEDWSEYSSVRLKRTDGIDAYKHICKYKDLHYHKTWEWLMPVVEKIEDIRFDNEDKDSFVSYHRYDVDNRGIGCTITDVQEGKVVGCGDYATKRESTYKAVIEFINNQNK